MRLDYSSGVKAAIASIVIFALLSNCLFLIKGAKSFHDGGEAILYWKRFHELKKALPLNTTIGYISDKPIRKIFIKGGRVKAFADKEKFIPVDTVNEIDKQAVVQFWLISNVLAPFSVSPTTDQKFVIGNFSNSDVDYSSYIEDSFILVDDYGNGLMLFKESTE